LFARRPADDTLAEKHGGRSYRCQLWDTDGLPLTAEENSEV